MNSEIVKQTKEYKDLISLGLEDFTSPREYKIGSLKFSIEFEPVNFVAYRLTRNGMLTEPSGGKQHLIHHFGTLNSLEDYRDALKVIKQHIVFHQTRQEIGRQRMKRDVLKYRREIIKHFFSDEYRITSEELKSISRDPLSWAYEALDFIDKP
jgi:hypothetical protein